MMIIIRELKLLKLIKVYTICMKLSTLSVPFWQGKYKVALIILQLVLITRRLFYQMQPQFVKKTKNKNQNKNKKQKKKTQKKRLWVPRVESFPLPQACGI